ncbi:purine-nucleoside phosphorylase [Mediterraneibacter sp. NSJ-55]|uniref:Purine nucleoside phosphorylase DeoD-type n=1 Tax=Mediterraneibacter hominis TaxID=2763054 RepID=A0A923RR68_9FIRM|nr:purine-nucleoside phosphorylase [Mediterraneibacter hominis]MBC5690314.1 purine-nucleoside phosphorylase [Mediterraneibacter hominis]
MGTPHNRAEIGDIAEKILLPGDPLRAKFIAENFLENAVCYNDVRGMFGYTGTYKGEKVSVQGTGMGMPSMHIYANELMEVYKVKKFIRVGTCGSLREDVYLKDVVIAMGSTTDSNMNKDRFGSISFAPTASFSLLKRAYEIAMEKKVPAIVSNIFTSDKFYDDNAQQKNSLLASYGIAAVDMETCELYTLAAKHHVEALTMLTVSDHLLTGEKCTAQERQTSFNDMIKVALEI